jgi:hypothetical protein
VLQELQEPKVLQDIQVKAPQEHKVPQELKDQLVHKVLQELE